MSESDRSLQERAQALYADCQVLAPEALTRRLDEACADDPSLRSAVEDLLAAERRTRGLVAQPSPAVPGDRCGERIGPFELQQLIGAGGMGRVYRARRVDGSFDQQVAVKLFNAGHLIGAGRERFNAERQILACLEHPGIARVIDGGDAADGTPYIAMELVQGQPITDWCHAHSVGVRGRLLIFIKVCEALEFAHRRGIVHRDIKPGNVLVDHNAQPKIIDFGIAKVLDAESVGVAAPWTATHLQLLTPEYASPEQVRGLAIGHASDVYSLGVLLYELLTGSRPYLLAERSPVAIERTVCQSVPLDPSQQLAGQTRLLPQGLPEAGSLRRQLRGDLDRIVMTALRKEPEQRFASAAELAADLQRHLAGLPVQARGASRWYRLGKFVQRNRAASLATLAVIVALSVALVLVSLQARQARLQAERAEAAKDFLVQMISQADPYENAGEPTMAGALRRAIPKIGEHFAGQPQLAAELRYAVGFSLEGLGQTAAAREQLELALDYYRGQGDPVPIARTLNALGRVSWSDSDYVQAEAQFEQALTLLEGLDSPAAARVRYHTLADLGGLLPKFEQFQRAEQVTREALALQPQISDLGPLELPVLWNNLATALEGNDDLPGAIAAYERSIELHRQAHRSHPDLAIALANLGMTYEIAGDLTKAVELAAEAAAMQDQVLGKGHPDALLQRYNLGSLQVNAGQLEAAAENLQQAVAGADQAYAPGHLFIGRFNHRLAEVLLQLGRIEQARGPALKAADLYAGNDEISEDWRQALDQIIQQLETAP